MKYFAKINAFYETVVYLTERFSEQRTSFRIATLKPSGNIMSDSDWACFSRIENLTLDLDNAFEPDELMKFYFTPFETKEKVPECTPLSLGYVLLYRPRAMVGQLNLSNLIEFYRSASLPTLLTHFANYLSTAYVVETSVTSMDISSFMTLVDGILADPQVKWNLMDVVTNPVRHIEALRETIENVEAFIEDHSRDYAELIKKETADFWTDPNNLDLVNSIGFNFQQEDMDKITIYPSLLSFNQLSFFTGGTDDSEIHIYIGILIYRIVRHRNSRENTVAFMNLLKIISDETRFKALSYMRDCYSFGQELAEQFHCTRNTMYYHLAKMMGDGLIDCKLTDYRTLYTMNKRNVYEKLTALRDFLVGGWTPKDGEEEP